MTYFPKMDTTCIANLKCFILYLFIVFNISCVHVFTYQNATESKAIHLLAFQTQIVLNEKNVKMQCNNWIKNLPLLPPLPHPTPLKQVDGIKLSSTIMTCINFFSK